MLIRLNDFLLQGLDHLEVGVAFLTLPIPGDLDLQFLDTLLEHLVFLCQVLLAFYIGLLRGYFFLLMLDDVAHLAEVVGTTHEPYLFKRPAGNLEVVLVVPVSFR